MIFMRLLALLAGSLVLIVPPVVAADNFRPNMSGWIAAGGLAGLSLVALSFLYIAAFGDRMRRSPDARMLGGLLLAIPAIAGIAVLATRTDPALLWCGGVLVAFAVLLFISFVFPAAADRRQRPMRERERTEPVLVIVQRHPSTERRASRS
jgi:MFS family permease